MASDTTAPLSGLSLREAAGEAGRTRTVRARRWWLGAAASGTLAAVLFGVAGHGSLVRPAGVPLVAQFFGAAAHPRADPAFLALTAKAAVTTLAFAVLGTAVSLAVGAVGGVLGSRVWWEARTGRRPRWPGSLRWLGWFATRVTLVVPRGIHEVVWGLLLLTVLGVEPLVAVLAIGIPFGAVTAKVFSEILDETAGEAHAALVASGAPKPAALLYGLLPPALPDLLSYAFYRLECAIRSAAVLGLLGVGGLGYQLQLSFQALRYREIWTLLYALVVLCAAADCWSWLVRRAAARGAVRGRGRAATASLAAAAGLVPFSAWWVGLSVAPLWNGRTRTALAQLAGDAWPPRLGPGGWGALLGQAGSTLAMSVIAIAVAFVGGAVLAFPAANLPRSAARGAAHRSRRWATVVVTRALLIVLRAIPPPVWALLVLFVLFPGVLPGSLALAAYTTGVLGRLMAEATENLDERPLRALRSHGASGAQVFCYGVVPSALPRFVAYGLYRWEVTVRETVVVGVVGAGGLGLVLSGQLAAFDYGGATGTLLTLTALTLLVDLVSASARRSLRA